MSSKSNNTAILIQNIWKNWKNSTNISTIYERRSQKESLSVVCAVVE